MSDHNERMLAAARQRLPEIDYDDFDVVQTGVDKWSFTDRESGVEYRRVDFYPGLHFGDPPTAIVAFTCDAGGQLHFLRQRGTPA